MLQLRSKLRSYQEETLDTIADTFWGENPQKSIIIVAPCAAGKTLIAAEGSWRLMENGYKSLIIAPYRELIDQFTTTLIFNGFNGTKQMYEMVIAKDPDLLDPRTQLVIDKYERLCKTKVWKPEIAYCVAGKPTTKDYSNIKVVIAMSQTIESRGLPDIPFKIIHLDEAHLTWYRHELQSKFQEYRYVKQVNFALYTATPVNHDGREYGKGVKLHQVITTKELIELGYNKPYYYLVLGQMERKQALKNDDLTSKEQLVILDKICDPETSWEKLNNPGDHVSSGRQLISVFKQRTVFFFSLRKVALQYMDFFRDKMQELGIGRELILIHANTPDSERKEAYLKFRQGKALLFNIMCLAIGFDEPSIENLVCFRPFSIAGLSNFIQIFGRLLRKYPGVEFGNFYDMCSNPQFADCLPDMITTWDLTDPKCIIPPPKEGKECEHCGTINGRAMKNCYMCGEELPQAKEKTTEEELDELTQRLLDWGNSQGYFDIDDQLLSDLQTQHLQITNLCNQLQIRDQTQQLDLNKCLVSIKSAIGGFVFRNDPLPTEKLQLQTYRLVELAESLNLQNHAVYSLIQQFETLSRKFLQDGETIKAADRALKKLREMAENKTTEGIKFLEISSSGGLSKRDIYRNLLKIGVLVKEYAPGWAYMQMCKMYGEKQEIDREWKRHAIFGENPTYGNYLRYRHFLWSKYAKKDGSNKDVFRELSAEFGKYCIEFNDRYMIENSRVVKAA